MEIKLPDVKFLCPQLLENFPDKVFLKVWVILESHQNKQDLLGLDSAGQVHDGFVASLD